MAKKTVPQLYWVASQDVTPKGQIRLTLLEQAEEGKGTAGCAAIMKSPEFAAKYRSLKDPLRVCIIRQEPALKLVAKDNDLAAKIKGLETLTHESILSVLAENGVDVSGEVALVEILDQGPGASVDPQVSEAGAMPPSAPEATSAPPTGPPEEVAEQVTDAAHYAAPTPPAAPQKFVDDACIVPEGWETLELGQVQQVAIKIDPAANETWDLAACKFLINKYLDTGLLGGPEASPPNSEGRWIKEMCPHCATMTWRQDGTDIRHDPVGGYPAHSCQGYLKSRQDQATAAVESAPPAAGPPPAPPAPPAAPPQPVTPPAAPLPTAPPATGIAAEPPARNGQAPPATPAPFPDTPPPATPPPPAPGGGSGGAPPGFGSGFGAPPSTPPPPPPPRLPQ